MTTEDTTPNIRLTRAQREKLKVGECPGITGTGKCPVGRDDVIVVVKGLEVRVLRVDPKANGWKLHYEVRDRRDPVRLVRRTPPVVAPRADNPNEDVIRQAARESSYTSSPRSAITDAGEAVDEKTVERYAQENGKRFRDDLEAERERRKRLPLAEQLEKVLDDARDRKVDVSGDRRVIEKRIDAMKRKADAA